MKLDRHWHSKRRAVAGIVATVFMFAMLFTVGASYFLYVNQNNLLYSEASSQRANALSSQHTEDLTIVGSADATTEALAFTAENLGAATATVVGFFVSDSSGNVLAFCQSGTGGSCPTLPASVNPGMTSVKIDTGVTYAGSNTYTISAVTQLGNVFTATYPPSAISLASQALASGAIGDLYLSFDSYTIYAVTSHSYTSSCPAASGTDSGFCLQTDSSHSRAGFAVPGSSYQNYYVGFSANLTNLNSGKGDIVLDQWSLLYAQVPAGANGKVPLVSWNIISVGTKDKANNLLPILKQYNPRVLPYNQPVTVYFATANCINAAQGPDDSCSTISSYGTSLANDFTMCPCHNNYPSASTIFIMSNGWKLAAGSYTLSELTYSAGTYGANYGQNTPFVSTLYY